MFEKGRYTIVGMRLHKPWPYGHIDVKLNCGFGNVPVQIGQTGWCDEVSAEHVLHCFISSPAHGCCWSREDHARHCTAVETTNPFITQDVKES